MTEPERAGGRRPGQRSAEDDLGVWSAATDPSADRVDVQAGIQAEAQAEAAAEARAEPERAVPAEEPSSPPAAHETPASGPAARETPPSRTAVPDTPHRPSGRPPSSRPGILDAPPGQAGRPPSSRTEPARTGPARTKPASTEPARPEPGRPQPRGRDQRNGQRRGADSAAQDLVAGLRRWLIRSSAKSMRRELEGQVKKTLGGGRAGSQDVWGTATTEPPPDPDQAPECAWCPICRAARRMRETSPGRGPQLSGVSDAVAAAVQDALGAFEGVLSRTAAPPTRERPADRSAGSGDADSAARDAAERAEHEPGDRS